ncbi:nucleotidyltransferase family protein [Parvibaculum sp.]|jgi:MurNAc alpha-1-phosphate uridylyltransferase|uniref:nucleotidyltransferase family protein n=1 Tax=Parvibaculum sp. TaxID=2024848 RepID=UPI000C57E893|nr:nucleotidyltransferase family protein [Parvibaculum sp.]HAC59086.1 mannose-1-phosphate guanylyltransferase [Rhodobiaceae bacterium]MAU61573.1 mannose-1-phosphate guanylyltransferase [Parvibaculum sp.]MBO6668154.1 nucleotidyltransferase family protein [Parvibaculum sp.]MBO6691688.1 nucleotidyltransferase family protein [Parvibaculum sp.]MBO6714728.1 nucleotidyltransferase family protein [Parvibaculum sp.]|tara:strand:- start:1673 stop:2386 length:714 start_codon:yes stop_codon:yes gene_type:complete
MKIKRAMVMAAGKGTRMRPLTDTRPKPLVSFAGRPLIDHVLDRLEEAGIEEAVVNVHHFANMLEEHLARRKGGPRIVISDERAELLDTGGGTKKALGLLGDDPIVTFNSDSVWVEGFGSNLRNLIDGFDPERMDALLMIADAARTIGFVGRGDFTMDPFGALMRREGSSTAPHVFAGVQVIKPALFAEGPDGPFSTNLIWDRLIEKGTLFGQRMTGVWMHVGAPDDLAEAEAFLRDL